MHSALDVEISRFLMFLECIMQETSLIGVTSLFKRRYLLHRSLREFFLSFLLKVIYSNFLSRLRNEWLFIRLFN